MRRKITYGRRILALSALLILAPSLTFAEMPPDERRVITQEAVDATLAAQKAAEDKARADKVTRTTKDFSGLNFGLGVGIVGTPTKDFAKSAQVVNGVVRVDDSPTVKASILLESHYFWTGAHPSWGHGPFVALRPGGDSNNIIDSIGLGYMVGFRYSEASPTSWNIGAGLSVTPNARVVGDGISRNEPLPAGETEVRFKNKSLLGFMILASFSWNSFGD